MLNKVHERGPLHLHRLAMSVIKCQDKVEEVGLAEIGGRLLLKMSSWQSYSTEDTTGRDSFSIISFWFEVFFQNFKFKQKLFSTVNYINYIQFIILIFVIYWTI